MEMHYSKVPPKTINYRDYKKFSNINFLNFFKEVFQLKPQMTKMVQYISLLVHGQKFSINKHVPFMNKHILKEIMKRSKLRNDFLKAK